MKCENNDSNCIAEILTTICILQRNACCCGDNCLDTCDRGFLGTPATTIGANTRPVMLYTCCANGLPWSMPTVKENITCPVGTNTEACSTVFRVEKVDDNCATFRVLARNNDCPNSSTNPYLATNSFFTMNLSCVCAIRCLNDVCIECI